MINFSPQFSTSIGQRFFAALSLYSRFKIYQVMLCSSIMAVNIGDINEAVVERSFKFFMMKLIHEFTLSISVIK